MEIRPFICGTKTAVISLTILMLALFSFIKQPVNSAQAQTPDAADVAAALDEAESVRVIVVLRTAEPGPATGLSVEAVAQAQQSVVAALPLHDFRPIQRFETLPGLVGEVTAPGLEILLNRPEVEAVALDLPVEAALTESVALIGADSVWAQLGFTGAGVNVAVLDTGLDPTHPDLADNLVAQKCFGHGICPPDNTAEGDLAWDGHGHGTHLAGIISGRGQSAPRGGAPDAGLVAVKVMSDSGSGFTSDVIAGIDWIIANQSQLKVKVINLSLGGGAYSGVCDNADANTQLYTQAIQAAREAGITIFAAAGNKGLANQMMAPACVSGVIAVGSTYDANLGPVTLGGCTDAQTTADQVTCISNSSPALDLLAPGAVIDSTALGGGQRRESGTSMATAHASAVAALMLSANTALTPLEIETILAETGVPITDSRNGRITPRVNALAAVSRVAGHQAAAVSGTVLLQGRTDHSGVQILLSEGPCAAALATASTTTTGPGGYFEIAALPAGQNQPYLQVVQSGYLTGQHNMPAGNLGVITLPGGDVTGDGLIDIFDLSFIALRYNGHDPSADITADGLVDVFDLVIAAGNYGREGPVKDWR